MSKVVTEGRMINEHQKKNKDKEQKLLEVVCKKYKVDPYFINHLVKLEMSMIGKQRRRGLLGKIEDIIQASLMADKGRSEE